MRPWRKQCWCIPERESARFVARMEDILDLYAGSHADDEPLVCMDEASKQLLRHDRPPELPAPRTARTRALRALREGRPGLWHRCRQ